MIDLHFFGEHAKFDHIGLAVQSIEQVVSGANIITDTIQNVSVSFVLLNGIKIELIEPFGNNTPITESLKKGKRLLHMCFRVPDINLAIKEGRSYGFHCIAKPVPAAAFKNKRIAWLFNRTYGLFELLEE